MLDHVLNAFGTLIILAIILGLGALGWSLIRFNLRRRAIAQALANATPQQLGRVIELIDTIGTEPSTGGILIPTNDIVDDVNCVVVIPDVIANFPWAGGSFEINVDADAKIGDAVSFSPTDKLVTDTQLLGRRYRYVGVPRIRTKTGKLRNVFDPGRYVKLCPNLMTAIEDISAEYPMDLLSSILCDGRIEFDSINQLRIGTSAAWVQSPEWRDCPYCHKRMILIIQLQGVRIHSKNFHKGTFFLFGCQDHPEITESVAQFT